MNYLPDATNHGAEIYTQVWVQRVERKDSKWLVHYQIRDAGRGILLYMDQEGRGHVLANKIEAMNLEPAKFADSKVSAVGRWLVSVGLGEDPVAVGVLSGQNTHAIAAFWYYRCDDIKTGEWYRDAKAKLALVYDVRNYAWSETSRSILATKADIAVPSDALAQLSERLKSG
jgi:hypothetical protein